MWLFARVFCLLGILNILNTSATKAFRGEADRSNAANLAHNQAHAAELRKSAQSDAALTDVAQRYRLAAELADSWRSWESDRHFMSHFATDTTHAAHRQGQAGNLGKLDRSTAANAAHSQGQVHAGKHGRSDRGDTTNDVHRQGQAGELAESDRSIAANAAHDEAAWQAKFAKDQKDWRRRSGWQAQFEYERLRKKLGEEKADLKRAADREGKGAELAQLQLDDDLASGITSSLCSGFQCLHSWGQKHNEDPTAAHWLRRPKTAFIEMSDMSRSNLHTVAKQKLRVPGSSQFGTHALFVQAMQFSLLFFSLILSCLWYNRGNLTDDKMLSVMDKKHQKQTADKPSLESNAVSSDFEVRTFESNAVSSDLEVRTATWYAQWSFSPWGSWWRSLMALMLSSVHAIRRALGFMFFSFSCGRGGRKNGGSGDLEVKAPIEVKKKAQCIFQGCGAASPNYGSPKARAPSTPSTPTAAFKPSIVEQISTPSTPSTPSTVEKLSTVERVEYYTFYDESEEECASEASETDLPCSDLVEKAGKPLPSQPACPLSEHVPSQSKGEKLYMVKHPVIMTDLPCLNRATIEMLNGDIQHLPKSADVEPAVGTTHLVPLDGAGQSAERSTPMDAVWFGLRTLDRYMETMGSAVGRAARPVVG